jgi:hypothetical protein
VSAVYGQSLRYQIGISNGFAFWHVRRSTCFKLARQHLHDPPLPRLRGLQQRKLDRLPRRHQFGHGRVACVAKRRRVLVCLTRTTRNQRQTSRFATPRPVFESHLRYWLDSILFEKDVRTGRPATIRKFRIRAARSARSWIPRSLEAGSLIGSSGQTFQCDSLSLNPRVVLQVGEGDGCERWTSQAIAHASAVFASPP